MIPSVLGNAPINSFHPPTRIMTGFRVGAMPTNPNSAARAAIAFKTRLGCLGSIDLTKNAIAHKVRRAKR